MAGKYEVKQARLRCPLCAQEHFDYSHSLSELARVPVRGQERPGDKHVFLCQACGCGIWFPASAAEPEEILECFECGAEIDRNDERCKSCGWSYMQSGEG